MCVVVMVVVAVVLWCCGVVVLCCGVVLDVTCYIRKRSRSFTFASFNKYYTTRNSTPPPRPQLEDYTVPRGIRHDPTWVYPLWQIDTAKAEEYAGGGGKRKRVHFGLAPYTVASRKMRRATMCILEIVQNEIETSTRVCCSFCLPFILHGSLGGVSDRFIGQAPRPRIRLVASLPKAVAITLKRHIILIIPRVGTRGFVQTSARDRRRGPQNPISESTGASFGIESVHNGVKQDAHCYNVNSEGCPKRF